MRLKMGRRGRKAVAGVAGETVEQVEINGKTDLIEKNGKMAAKVKKSKPTDDLNEAALPKKRAGRNKKPEQEQTNQLETKEILIPEPKPNKRKGKKIESVPSTSSEEDVKQKAKKRPLKGKINKMDEDEQPEENESKSKKGKKQEQTEKVTNEKENKIDIKKRSKQVKIVETDDDVTNDEENNETNQIPNKLKEMKKIDAELEQELRNKRTIKSKKNESNDVVQMVAETEAKTTKTRARKQPIEKKQSDVKPNKRPANKLNDKKSNDFELPPKIEDGVTKRKKIETNIKLINEIVTDHNQINYQINKEFTLKIVSWNVAGLRALVSKGGFDFFEHENPDIICLQEIKCLEEEVPDAAKLNGYHPYWCSTKGGRGGVAILSKTMPYQVENNIGDEEMDAEGRIITAEYSKFYLVCVYVPNAGTKLINIQRRLRWNQLFLDHINKLKEKKGVIICGDMNVAHEEIDLTNPKTNHKNAGFSKEEREGMTELLGNGYIDTFRYLYPEQADSFTFWSNRSNARKNNVGWRLDYSIVSDNLKTKIVDSLMRPQVLGSDHCPIVLLMNF